MENTITAMVQYPNFLHPSTSRSQNVKFALRRGVVRPHGFEGILVFGFDAYLRELSSIKAKEEN